MIGDVHGAQYEQGSQGDARHELGGDVAVGGDSRAGVTSDEVKAMDRRWAW